MELVGSNSLLFSPRKCESLCACDEVNVNERHGFPITALSALHRKTLIRGQNFVRMMHISAAQNYLCSPLIYATSGKANVVWWTVYSYIRITP